MRACPACTWGCCCRWRPTGWGTGSRWAPAPAARPWPSWPCGPAGPAPCFAEGPGERVALVDLNSEAVPIALFGASLAGKPFVPINYRLTDEQLQDLVAPHRPRHRDRRATGVAERLGSIEGISLIDRDELLERVTRRVDRAGRPLRRRPRRHRRAPLHQRHDRRAQGGRAPQPQPGRLRHLHRRVRRRRRGRGGHRERAAVPHRRHLLGAVVDLLAAAGWSTSSPSSRRVGASWCAARQVTHAMVVPTMLSRILDVVEADGDGLPTAAGALLRRRPDAGGGDRAGHRPAARGRLRERLRAHRDVQHPRPARPRRPPGRLRQRRPGGAGPPRLGGPARCPASRCRSATPTASRCPTGSGARSGCGATRCRASTSAGATALDEGWFRTRDAGHLDDAGYLYVHGRLDDVIVRGGENLSPGEIENVLIEHPAVAEAAVVGIPDAEWGEAVAAVVVLEPGAEADEAELQDHVRARLRSTKTPDPHRDPGRAPLQRDRQAPPPGAPRRAGRASRLTSPTFCGASGPIRDDGAAGRRGARTGLVLAARRARSGSDLPQDQHARREPERTSRTS